MKEKLHKSMIWSGLGFFVNKGTLFCTILFGSHFLSPDDYIRYSIFLIAVNTFSGVVGGALSLTANRYTHKETSTFGMYLLVLLFSIACGLIYYIYILFFDKSIVGIIESLYVFGITNLTALNGIYYAKNKFKEYALINTFVGASTLLLSSLIIFHHDYIWFLCGLIIPVIVYAIWSSFYFVSKSVKLISTKNVRRSLTKVFFPSLISGMLFQPAIFISAELVLKFAPNSDLITFSVANQFRIALMSFSIIIGSILIRQLVVSNDRLIVNKKNIEMSYYPLLIIVSGMSLALELIFSIFGQMNFDSFVLNMTVVLGIVLISSINSAVARNFIVDEKGRVGVLNNLTWLITFIPLSCLFIPKFGAFGANLSFFIACLSQFLVWLPYCLKNQYLSSSFFSYSLLLSTSLCGIILFLKLTNSSPLISIFLFILIIWLATKRIFYATKNHEN